MSYSRCCFLVGELVRFAYKLSGGVAGIAIDSTIEIKPFEWNDFVDAYHEKFEKEKNVWRCVFTVGKIQITEINPD